MNSGPCFRYTLRTALRLSVVLAILILSPAAWPQSDDAVHVVPRDEHIQPAAEADNARLNAEPGVEPHPKPLRADVDLVLVPATVTDAQNRPVMNLAKGNFALYEDDQQQQIQTFTREDAPI